ncbi:MAG TPA: MFS transporter [Dongiaceae bacterium]|nr:MFS transporter [Dongiaceae bacterium]
MHSTTRNSGLVSLSGLRLFYFLLFGQSLSVLGSTLTNFALGVWAYKTGGNVTDFTLIAIASTLPGILLGPFIGSLVDRLDRKWLLFWAQLGSATGTFTLAALYWTDALQVWHIILVVPIASLCGSVLQIGFSAVVGTLVPPGGLSRANGVLGLVFGVVQLGSPLLAGLALDHLGLKGIFAIDLMSYVIGLLSLLVISLPSVIRKEKETKSSLWQDVVEGYLFLKSKPGVLGGLYLFTLIWFNVSAVQILMLPLVLSIGSSTDLGFIQSMAGAGTLIGGLLMVAWKGPERKAFGILVPAVVIACILVVMPMRPEIAWLAGCAVLIMMAAPIAAVCSQTLWQRKVPVHFHGRAFSLRKSIMKAAQPLAFLSAGLFADHLFNPMMMEGTVVSRVLGPVWGVGEGRGVAVMISLFGVISLIMVILAWLTPAIRRGDIDLPDETV